MEDEESCEVLESPFHFFPPLAMQRCSFCLGILKRLKTRSVLELGCGEGTLLGLLTNAAIALGEFPSTSDLEFLSTRLNQVDDAAKKVQLRKIEKILQQTPELDIFQRDLHLELLLGLDLEQDKLERLHELIQQTNSNCHSDSFHYNTRWEPLRVELWCGDLSVNNERFADVECVVMSEVIEHLFPEQFDKSIPLLFGKYQPQWIVITTPNYEFNQHIDQYSSPQSRSKHRYLDPTNRSERYFRDSDHKFEWTQDEFKEWCESISSTYGYDYEITGCGSYKNYFHQSIKSLEIMQKIPKPQIPMPDCPETFFATQIVVFEKRTKNFIPKTLSSLTCQNETTNEHKLIGVENYLADESSCNALTAPKILESVKHYLKATQQSQVQLRELWLCNFGLDKLCGGKLIELLMAFSDEDDWDIEVREKSDHSSQLTGMDAIWITWLKFPIDIQNQLQFLKIEDSQWMKSWG